MTVNETIINALSQFGLTVTPDFFGGGADEYFTFNYADDRAVDFGDDAPDHVVAYMQIHYFAPMWKDYLSIKKKVRKALFQAGFTYPDVTDVTDTESEIRHLVFECDIENEDELQ
jgi:hypothetical protein